MNQGLKKLNNSEKHPDCNGPPDIIIWKYTFIIIHDDINTQL